MAVTSNSLAAVTATSIENEAFAVSAAVLKRKHIIVGTYDPAITSLVDNELIRVLSPEDVGARTGFGFMLQRLAKGAFAGNGGLPTYISPQAEVAGDQSTGSIVFTASSASARTIYLYVAGLQVQIPVAAGDDGDAIAIKVVAALDALTSSFGLPTTQEVDGVTTDQVNFTSKSKGLWGDDISLTFNWGAEETLPEGVTVIVTDMSGGTGTPDIQEALDELGTGDGQNEVFFTDFNHGYGLDSSTLDKISIYNGIGNEKIGNYSDTVHRPFRSLNGEVAPGSGGFSAITAIGDGRKLDRTNGVYSAPGSPNHPAEIAALVLGIFAKFNNRTAESWPQDVPLPGMIPGKKADRWTSEYNNRDSAVKAGVSPSHVINNALTIQNVVTFYHPDNVPQESNGFRSIRNISVGQNMLSATHLIYSGQFWKGISIVSDKKNVTNIESRDKVRDIDDVIATSIALVRAFAANGWVYDPQFTIDELKSGDKVAIRPGQTGFDIIFPVIFSGEGGILNTNIKFDTSIAVLL